MKRPEDNPETAEALLRRIPIIKRAEMLGELMRAKRGVGVAGTHGKTTTTTLVGLVLQAAELDPTIIVGGKVAVFGCNAVAGLGEVIVVEADEYDRTFLKLTPIHAVVTNIEADHLDIYADLDDIKDAFVQFVNSVPFFGAAILCLDDANVRDILGRVTRRVVTYGTSRQATLRAENVEQIGATTRFDVYQGVRAPRRHHAARAGPAQRPQRARGRRRRARARRALRDHRARARAVLGRGPPLPDQGRGARAGQRRPAAAPSSSSTTTRTTRPRSRRRSRRPPAAGPSAASSPCSSRTSTAARATSPTTSRAPSTTPTCSC